MVTGRRAFQRDTGVETLSAIIREDPKPIAEIAPDAPAPVKWIAERCLEKDPEERYASTRDLARELASVRDHLSEVSRSGEAAAAAGAPRKNRRFGWVVAALAGLVAGALLSGWLRRAPAPTEPTAVRFLTYSGDDLAPAVSPDGRTVAFSSARDGRPRIWLKQLAGGNEVPLTEGQDDSPRFSPDGSQVLFVRNERGVNALYRVPVLGGEARKIIGDAVEADWSYDGTRIAFLRFEVEKNQSTSLVWIVSADGGQPRQIAAVPNRQLNHPRWSPDDKTVAFSEVAAGGATKSFFLVDVGSGEVREVSTGSAGLASSLAWTKTPNHAVYSISESAVAAVTGSAAAVMLLDVKTERKRPLFWSPMNGDVLDVLGPGTVVFDVRSVKENIQELRLSGHQAVGEPVWLTHGNSSDRQPTYSPDGEWILFSSTRSGNQDLWMMSTKTGAVRRLTDDPGEDWDPAFTRDGRQILWSSNRSGAFEVWMADSDGSNVRQVTREGHDAENPTATPDGKWIVFNQGSGPDRGIRKVRFDGSGASQVLKGTTVLPDLSPDGEYVSFRLNIRVELFGLRVARLSDGSVVSTFDMDLPQRRGFTGNSIARSRWMPDGKAIVFVGQDEKGTYGLFTQEFDPNRDTSATRRPLAGFDPAFATETMAISPDGTRLAFAGPEQASSLMFAERVPGVDRPTRK
jgi:Tol biopolymer transport system component